MKSLETIIEEISGLKSVKDNGIKVIAHPKGEVSNGNEDLAAFIAATNSKYFNSSSDELLGDFVELHFENGEYIRINIGDIDDTSSIEDIVNESLSYCDNIRDDARSVINNMSNYEFIKDKLILRPLNLTSNKAALNGACYINNGDVALVLYLVVKEDDKTMNTAKVPEDIVKLWGINRMSVMIDAMNNTAKKYPARMFTNLLNINDASDSESDFMSDAYNKKFDSGVIPMVTTTKKTNGAISLFYPKVKEKIAEMFGDSFYVAFTSIHEAMLHKKGTIEPSDIRRHIRATNLTFGPEETLSDEVFFYDSVNKTFSVVE